MTREHPAPSTVPHLYNATLVLHAYRPGGAAAHHSGQPRHHFPEFWDNILQPLRVPVYAGHMKQG